MAQGMDFFIDLPSKMQSGDLFAIMVALILLYCIVVILKKFTRLVAPGAKIIFISLIIIMAAYIFFKDFLLRLMTEGLTPDNMIFGLIGFLCGILAVGIALFKAVRAYKKGRQEKKKQTEPESLQTHITDTNGEVIGTHLHPWPQPAQPAENQQLILPFMNLTKDNSAGMVIIYLIVAEFGIFSSKTIAAANADTGFAFFLIFMFAALIFIKLTYNNYITGLKHFALAFIMGFGLSIVLGFFWGGIPLETLLSKEYFATDALVALITGLSLSLFMGGKGK